MLVSSLPSTATAISSHRNNSKPSLYNLMHLLLLTIEEHCSLHTKQAVSYNEGKMLMQMVAKVGKAGCNE